MVTTFWKPPLAIQRGSTMIEVLVAIVVLTLGLLGLAGLQSRLQISEMEAYQRSQAVLLVNDMASRLAANRAEASSYAAGASVSAPLGAGMTCPTTTSTRVQRDLSDWCNALQGSAETISSSRVGALVGGRGCVELVGTSTNDYRVTVAWQGLVPVASRAGAVPDCGLNSYDGGSNCTGNLCRRLVSTLVRIPTL